jgi:hypothetical protein
MEEPMNEYQRLTEKLRGRPFLIADGATGRVRLANQQAVFRAMAEGGEFPSSLILNAGGGLKRFARLRGVGEGDREFTLKDIAAIAGMSYHLTYHYASEGVLNPSVRDFGGPGNGEDNQARFSWTDAFCAGIVGSLRRHGLGLDVLRKVQPLFTDSKKRTAKRRQPAERS